MTSPIFLLLFILSLILFILFKGVFHLSFHLVPDSKLLLLIATKLLPNLCFSFQAYSVILNSKQSLDIYIISQIFHNLTSSHILKYFKGCFKTVLYLLLLYVSKVKIYFTTIPLFLFRSCNIYFFYIEFTISILSQWIENLLSTLLGTNYFRCLFCSGI